MSCYLNIIDWSVSTFTYITNHWPQVLVSAKIPWPIMCYIAYSGSHGSHRALNLVPTHLWGFKGRLWTSISLVAQTVKVLPAMRETRVRFLGRDDPLEKEMAIHSSTLAWKIPWTEEPDRLQSMGSQSRTRLSDFTLNIGIVISEVSYSHSVLDILSCFQIWFKKKKTL